MRQIETLMWEPCRTDPLVFDCRDCDRGVQESCRFWNDESLRFERAVRWRRSAGLARLDSNCVRRVLAIARRLLKGQGLAVPAVLVHEGLTAGDRRHVSPESVESLLRYAEGIVELTPGMFVLSLSRGVVRAPALERSGPVSAGAMLAAVLSAIAPESKATQRVALKRFRAVKRIAEVAGRTDAKELISRMIDDQAPHVLSAEGWTMADANAFAMGPKRPAPVALGTGERARVRSEFLTNIHALELLTGTLPEAAGETLGCLREVLFRNNAGLVSWVARRAARGGSLEYTDLFQEGARGLLTALDRFDPYRGYEFATYAVQWIRQAVWRAQANLEALVRIPIHAQDKLRRAATASVTWHRIEGFKDEWAVEGAHGDVVEEEERRDIVERVVTQACDEREQRVLRARYGLGGGVRMTLEEVGAAEGLTRERIRQIEAKALRKLGALRWKRRLMGVVDGDVDAMA